MPYRQCEFQAEHYYHIYNRGNNYDPIFYERENYLFFLRQLRKYLRPEKIAVIAYCLMPNHYHLLAALKADDLPRMMQPFVLSYTKAINERYSRVGSLFQGRFKAIHVAREEYLLHLARYIHLNPVAAGLTRTPEQWEFSNYRDILGLRPGNLAEPDIILSQFPTQDGSRRFVEAYVEADRELIQQYVLD